MGSRQDPIALSFNEICLRLSDVELLRGPRWLNDQILSFYFEYLQNIRYKTNPDMLFVSPEVTQCAKLMHDSDLGPLLDPLDAGTKPFIFFPLNNNSSTNAGGTHWSLLVFSRPEKTFFHFDSWSDKNSSTSQEFAQNVRQAINSQNGQVKQLRCLQQANGYDCGIHVICMADQISDHVNRFDCVEGVTQVNKEVISIKRSEILKLIKSLGGKA